MSLEERVPEDSGAIEGDRIGRLLRLVGPREAVPAEREVRVRTAIREVWLEEVGHRARRRRRFWTAGTLALAAASLLALGLVYRNRLAPAAFRHEPGPVATVRMSSGLPDFAAGRALPGGARIETGLRGRMAISLGSGPTVRLDTETSVALETASSLSLERGAVYVDTGDGDAEGADAGSAAIEVHTPFGTARDVGTRFEVRVGEGSVRVRVREGEVLFARGGETHSAETGAELEVDAAGEVSRGRVPLFGASWLWVLEASPAFRLEGATLQEILDWTARETGWRIRYGKGAQETVRPLLGEVLQGTVPIDARADQVVFEALMTYGLEARLEGGTLWVERLR